MVDLAKLQNLINEAAETEPDMNEAVSGGGGDYVPPAAGMVRLRFVQYIELGVHEEEFKGEKKKKDKVKFVFELSGPKHPKNEETGKYALFTILLDKSQNEKSHFYKLFKRMNYDGKAKIFAQLLGQDFLGTIVHTIKGEGDAKKTYANLRDESGYTIRPPFVEDPESGETKRIKVDEPTTPIKAFLWAHPDKEMWDDIFIDGNYDDKKDKDGKVIEPGKSKNYNQNKIKAALNFSGSPIAELLFSGGLDVEGAEKPARSEKDIEAANDAKAGADADPLAEAS